MSPKRLLLASQSLGRKKLFRDARLNFIAKSPHIDERRHPNEIPLHYVTRLAETKARAFEFSSLEDDIEVIVAADSIVLFEGNIIGKPHDRADAIQMLSKLQGKTHQLLSGVAVRTRDNRLLTTTALSEVTLSPMTPTQIETYVDLFHPYYFAGAYESDGITSSFIESIHGSPSNVIGLPMEHLRLLLEKLGYFWFDFVLPLQED